MSVRILVGDCIERMRELEDGSVHCAVTSPPYWGLRDYGTATWEGGSDKCPHEPSQARWYRADGSCRCGATRVDSQLGLEPTPEEYVENMVGVFREVRRVLRDDGTLWLNLGDSYAGSWGAQGRNPRPPPQVAVTCWNGWMQ